MKSERGITLATLVLYSTIMLLVITAVSVIKVNTDKNIENLEDMKGSIPELNKISMYMLSETKNSTNAVKKISGDGATIEFTNGDKYIFADKALYKWDSDNKKIKICENVMNCIFKYSLENGNDIVRVTIQIGSKEIITKTMDYIFS